MLAYFTYGILAYVDEVPIIDVFNSFWPKFFNAKLFVLGTSINVIHSNDFLRIFFQSNFDF